MKVDHKRAAAAAPERPLPDRTPNLELPEGLPHPVGPRLMIEKGAFSSRTVVILPDGTIAPEPAPTP